MLVKDLKNVLKEYKRDDLEKIIVELYKKIPKYKKEEYDIDDYIINVNSLDKVKEQKKELDFDSLSAQLMAFLSNVDNEYYYVPNKVVPKKERSAWRLTVKNYYKQLISIPHESENGGLATFFLIEIFKRLSIGTRYAQFITYNTFKSIGVYQSDYYDVIVKRVLSGGYTKENIKTCIDLLLLQKDGNDMHYRGMYSVLLSSITDAEDIETTINLLNDLKCKLYDECKNSKNYFDNYYLKENINEIVETILIFYSKLKKMDEGIKYFDTNYIVKDIEVKKYVLLNIIDDLDELEIWIREYEKDMKKIKYRDSLIEKYNEYKK